jgi:hypothetical protein
MKKSILSIALVAAIAVAGAWNFAQNQEEVTLSDLALENVDALAQEIIVGPLCAEVLSSLCIYIWDVDDIEVYIGRFYP